MKSKRLIALLMTIVMSMLSITPVLANSTTVYDPWLSLIHDVMRLQDENEDLRQQLHDLENQPRPPAAVHAPNPRLLRPHQVTVNPGQTLDVELTIRNIGSNTAFNVMSTAAVAAAAPFTVELVGNAISNITENGQRTITMRITVDSNAAAGNHAVTLTHMFRNADRANSTTTDTLNVRITGDGDAGQPVLEVRNMTEPIGTTNVGQTATISFYVHNTGNAEARNIRVVAAPESATDIVPVQTPGTQTIQSLAPGQSQRLTFNFSPRTSATSRSYAIGFTVNYGETSFQQFTVINVNNPEEPDDGIAHLEIRNMNAPTGNFRVGETAAISFYVYNSGDAEARNIRVVAAPEVPANLVPVQAPGTQTIQALAPGESQRMTFYFSPRTTATTRSYAVGFTVNHGEMNFQQFAAVNVYNPADDDNNIANLEMRNMNAPSGNIGVGQTATITFDVHNRGTTEARNIRVVATPESATDIVPVQTSSTQTIQSLAPGASARMTFSFSPRDTAQTRSYGIGFTVTYGEASSQQFAVVNVYNPEEGDTPAGQVQIPRVMVAGHVLTPAVPLAGTEFEMEISFRNTSATRSVNNVRILIEEVVAASAPGQQTAFAGFSPVDGSNTLFIDFLGPQEVVTMTLRFTTVTEATPGAHNMRFSFDYQDQDFIERTANQLISIPVRQFGRLELENVRVGDWGTPMVGSGVDFSYSIINSGRVDLLNIRTRAEGPFDVDQAGRYIGTVRAQRTTGFDGRIIPFEAGMQTGVFIVYGEDPSGAIVEVRYEFEIFVEGGMDFDEGFDYREGGGMGDMDFMRPGLGDIQYGWCHVANEEIQMGYMCPETFEWVSFGEWCMETGAWVPYDSGFEFLAFVRRPVVWGPTVGAVVLLMALVVGMKMRKKSYAQFDDEDDV